MEDSSQSRAKQITPIYMAETALKAAYLVMAPFNLPYTIIVGLLASLCGLFRMLKKPELNKAYLQKALMNNHGQNILYLGMGSVGVANFLFYSPIMLYFFYGLAEFYNLKFPGATGNAKIHGYVDQIRNNRWYFMETKSRLEILCFVYLLITIPIDFGRILKCLLIGQYNMLRYRVTAETKHAATNINNMVKNKISGISFLLNIWNKITDFIFKIANQNQQWL